MEQIPKAMMEKSTADSSCPNTLPKETQEQKRNGRSHGLKMFLNLEWCYKNFVSNCFWAQDLTLYKGSLAQKLLHLLRPNTLQHMEFLSFVRK